MLGIKKGWTAPVLLVAALGVGAVKVGMGYLNRDSDSLLFGAVAGLIAAIGFMFLWARERERLER